MLVDVLTGPDELSATSTGNFYFARSPGAGEQIEIEGKLLRVRRAWHRPDVHFSGAKYAILVAPWDPEDAQTAAHDEAGSVV